MCDSTVPAYGVPFVDQQDEFDALPEKPVLLPAWGSWSADGPFCPKCGKNVSRYIDVAEIRMCPNCETSYETEEKTLLWRTREPAASICHVGSVRSSKGLPR